jgi:hypothetical protein
MQKRYIIQIGKKPARRLAWRVVVVVIPLVSVARQKLQTPGLLFSLLAFRC